MKFTTLLSPGSIGSLKTKNRIVMAPMGTNFASPGGFVTGRLIDYYRERARGGCGLVICGDMAIDAPRGQNLGCQLAVSSDDYLVGLRELTDAIHHHGASVAAQLVHAGKLAMIDMVQGHQPLAPSEFSIGMKETLRDLTRDEFTRMAARFTGSSGMLRTREMTIEDIGALVKSFASAALRAKKAGFDGIEIHAGHGYLISSFLSPATNKRQDEYGGDIRNRARFLLEILAAVRVQTGGNFPVWCRIDCREFNIKGGLSPEDALQLAVFLEEAGADSIHVSGYGGTVGGFIDAPIVYRPGYLLPYVRQIKKTVTIPVIAVGRISPEAGENLLRKKEADFIAMGRPLLADPSLPEKLRRGQTADIRPCVYCYHCVSRHLEDLATECAVNPAVGREAEFKNEPAGTTRNVAIIGSGPAGMEAAITAAGRGHKVTLIDKAKIPGGSLTYASVVNPDLEKLVIWLRKQLRTIPIQIQTRLIIDPQSLTNSSTDTLIVANGPSIDIPDVVVNAAHVITGYGLRALVSGELASITPNRYVNFLLTLSRPFIRFLSPSFLRSLTKLWMPVGNNVAIVGGDLVSVELADFLSQRKRNVTVLTERQDIGGEMTIPARWRILKELRKRGVQFITDATVKSINGKTVAFQTYSGLLETLEADTVILSGKITPNNELFEQVKDRFPQVYQAGDCSSQRLLRGSIEDGTRIGLDI